MDRIERYFDSAIKSPDGIKKLREMILSLAMQGKLVPQDPNDPPASELLKEIESEKKKLIKEGKIKKQDPLPPIKPEEVPYALPAGWEWVRLVQVLEIYNGRAYKANELLDSGTPVLRVGNLFTSNHWYYSNLSLEESKYINKGDLIFAWSASFGPFIWTGTKVIYHYHIWKLSLHKEDEILKAYLYKFLSEKTFEIQASGHGIAMKHMTKERMEKLLTPLPPLAEQKRIVAKVDALMALCDKLEAERDARNAKRVAVQKTALDRLLAAQDQAAFDSAWAFIARNFADLYSVPENVAELKKAILQLAVMGKLVPQAPNDQPASELLKEIEAEKKKLIKAGKIKKQEPLPPIKPEEVPYALPAGWEWVRVQDIGFLLGGKRLPKGYDFSDAPTPYRYLTVTNMKEGSIVDNNVKYIDEITRKVIEKYIICKEDIYITIAGTIGAVGTVPDKYDGMNLTENASRLIFFKMDKQFLVNLLSSDLVQKQFYELTNKMAQPKLALRSILSAFIPLPPLAEQKRIVAKVDALIARCDELERQLKDATDKQTAILNAVVAAM